MIIQKLVYYLPLLTNDDITAKEGFMIEGVRIYQLVDSRSYGGIERHIYHLCKWLTQNEVDSEVVFLADYGSHPLKDELDNQSISHHTLTSNSELISLLRANTALLCTHGYKAGIIGRFAALLTNSPVISTFHSGDLGNGLVKLYSYLDLYSAFLADVAISVSDEIAQKLPSTSTTIANFVPEQRMLPARGKAIAFVGRLSIEKNPLCFADATQDLSHPCHIYGDGPLMGHLQKRYTHLKLFGHVDMNAHWKNIGVLCITSNFEGLPLVALEAMIRGIPVISFEIGGLPNLITDNLNGWLVPANNTNKLKSAIKNWLKKPQHIKNNISISAHRHILNNYTDRTCCPAILEIYKKAIFHKQVKYKW